MYRAKGKGERLEGIKSISGQNARPLYLNGLDGQVFMLGSLVRFKDAHHFFRRGYGIVIDIEKELLYNAHPSLGKEAGWVRIYWQRAKEATYCRITDPNLEVVAS